MISHRRSFDYIDLGLPVEQSNAEATVDSYAVRIWEEDVADLLSISEGMVGNRFLDCS
jgi:hypothetical protein